MRAALLIAITLLLPKTGLAQIAISGTVVDSGGAAVPIVVVSAGGESVMTDSNGRFRLTGLEPGTYPVTFRRIGYRERTMNVTAPDGEREYGIGNVVLEQLPEVLDEITVEALAPIMTQQAINVFNFKRREGVARYFFTAYDIERLRLQQVSDIWRYIPGARRGSGALNGNTIQLMHRGGICTASVWVNGVNTRNQSLDTFLIPERVGAIWFTPRECKFEAWTKPASIGEASPFEIGLRFGAGVRGERLGTFGGFLVAPIRSGPIEVYPAFDAGFGRARVRWQFQVALRLRLPGRDSPWYVGTGVSFAKSDDDILGRQTRDASHILLTGLGVQVGPVRPFGELRFADLVTPGTTRIQLFTGIAYAHR